MGKDYTRSVHIPEARKVWFVVDASGKTLGRLATHLSMILRGKHRPGYTKNVDTGDFVVVVNAEKVVLTGKKAVQKTYDHMARGGKHKGTAWAHGLHIIPYEKMMRLHPDRIVRLAVKRMMRNTKMNRQAFTKLKVYAGPSHPHEAQKPTPLEIKA